jgi:hypothetical protein
MPSIASPAAGTIALLAIGLVILGLVALAAAIF